MANPDLARWLDTVTQGMTADIADLIRDEISAHYDDAHADYLAEGHSSTEAHRLAMRDLGDESVTAKGFQRTHSTERRYLMIGLLGLAYPFVYLLTIPINQKLIGGIGFNLAIFLPLIYILHSFRVMIQDRFQDVQIEKNILLIRWGIIVLCLARFMGWLLYKQPTVVESYTRSLWDAISFNESLLSFASLAGLFLLSVGIILVGEQVFQLRQRFDHALKPLCVVVMVCGISFVVYGIGSLYGNLGIAVLAELTGVIAGMMATLLWASIFFRERASLVQVTS